MHCQVGTAGPHLLQQLEPLLQAGHCCWGHRHAQVDVQVPQATHAAELQEPSVCDLGAGTNGEAAQLGDEAQRLRAENAKGCGGREGWERGASAELAGCVTARLFSWLCLSA